MYDPTLPPQKVLKNFRHGSMAQQIREASVSARRWWWEYLRLSKDYWLLCMTCPEGKPETYDEALAKTFIDFGNVHEGTFEDWWLRTGSALFAETELPPRVQELTREGNTITTAWTEGKIVVEIPLQLTLATVQAQIDKILEDQADRPNRQLKVSTSRYPINVTLLRLNVLKQTHEVHCLHRELIEKPKALAKLGLDNESSEGQTRADLFRIGKLMRLSMSNATLGADLELNRAKQRDMRSAVSRFLGKATDMIGNVEHGVFPGYEGVSVPKPRFSSKQECAHADLEAQWWSLDLFSGLSRVKAEDARRIHYAGD